MSHRKEWLIKSSLAIVSVIVVLALVEISMRLFWPQRDVYIYRYKNGYLYNLQDFDNLFSQLPRDFAAKIPRKTYVRRIRTNARGQRDDVEHSYKKEKNKIRILNLGDSIGFGWPVDLKDTYLKVLEKNIPDAETVNCSLIGVNTPRLLEIYEKDCGRYEADVVVLQMTITHGGWPPDYLFSDELGPDHIEIYELLTAGRTDYLKEHLVRDEKWGIMGLDDEDPVPEYTDLLRKQTSPRFPFYHQLNIIRFIENRTMNVERRFTDFGKLRNALGMPYHEGKPFLSPGPTIYYLSKLKESVESRGAKLVVVIIPNLTGYQFLKVQGRERHDLKKLITFLESNHYHFLDFTERFRSYKPERIYFIDESHPNENGYRIIGEELARFIKQKVLICDLNDRK